MPESGLPIRVYKERDMWHVDYGDGETTADNADRHFLGWLDDVDPDEAGRREL